MRSENNYPSNIRLVTKGEHKRITEQAEPLGVILEKIVKTINSQINSQTGKKIDSDEDDTSES